MILTTLENYGDNAFEQDAYRPLHWPPLDISTRGGGYPRFNVWGCVLTPYPRPHTASYPGGESTSLDITPLRYRSTTGHTHSHWTYPPLWKHYLRTTGGKNIYCCDNRRKSFPNGPLNHYPTGVFSFLLFVHHVSLLTRSH